MNHPPDPENDQNFEDELRRALSPQSPSPDFTQQVLAKVVARPFAPSRRRLPVRQLLSAIAASLAITAGLLYQHHLHQLAGEAAKEKLFLALRITGAKLQQVQQQVNQVPSPEVN